jgi:plastocyanin
MTGRARVLARVRRALPIALAALLAAVVSRAQEPPGSVRGRVTPGVEGARLADLGPIVVYLEPLGGNAGPPPAAPAETAEIRQHAARFSPGFMAIAVGQSIEMPNDDAIYHNVFSYSKGNRFDLGLYPAGESRTVRFGTPGVVKIYCSIHESMNGTIFVAPAPHFAQVSASGRFAIEGVPAGRYRLRTWCERLPDTGREIRVGPGQEVAVDIPLAATATP